MQTLSDAIATPPRPAKATADPDRRRTARALKQAGLTMVQAEDLTITRRRTAKGFCYLDGKGRRIKSSSVLQRIRALAIPPAYEDVRIAADRNAHLQAIGRDEAGRTQHRYHPEWDAVREDRKIARLARLIDALPRIRTAVRRDMASRKLDKTKAVACAVAMIDAGHIRVGGEAYARTNGSHGAATLLKRHVDVRGARLELSFIGKGAKSIECSIDDPGLARAVKRIKSLPGRRLLRFKAEDGGSHPIRSSDINAYLRHVAGVPVTAKDLRTLAASASAAEHLVDVEPAASEGGQRRQLAAVMRAVSEQLSNTPAVVRKSYVHAVVVQAFTTGALKRTYDRTRPGHRVRRIERTLGALVGRLMR